jgi:putative membrane protein
MLWTSALVLSLHVLSFMLTYAAVAAEYALLRGSVDGPTIRSLGTADAVYGLSAVVVFATGTLQVLYFGTGVDYYLQSPLLWGKVGLFTLVGIASVYPTMTFLRWQAEASEVDGPGLDAPPTRIAGLELPPASAPRLPRLRRVVAAELVLLTLLPFLGSALNYGLG